MTLTKDTLDPRVVARLLGDIATVGTVLHILALVSYGQEIYGLDILEILERFKEDYGVELPEENENKLQAMLTAVSTEAFHNDTEAFDAICNALSSGDPGLDLMDDVTLPEMLWAMFEVELNRGADHYSPGVQRRIEAVLSSEMDPESDPNPYRYAQAFVADQHAAMTQQLESLGVQRAEIPAIPQAEDFQAAA